MAAEGFRDVFGSNLFLRRFRNWRVSAPVHDRVTFGFIARAPPRLMAGSQRWSIGRIS